MAIVDSVFGALASKQNLQAVIDNSVDTLYTKSIWRQYLDWGLPQWELSFESVIGRSRIQAAASIVDPDAPAPKRSRGFVSTVEGKIPTMKEAFDLNQKDYRALKQLESLPISDNEKKVQLIKKLIDDVTNAVSSTDIRLDIMFLQALSTFQIDISIINNPDGVVFGTVDLLPNADQTVGVSVMWTDAANADPFKDIETVVAYAALSGRKFSKIMMDLSAWYLVKNATKVKSAISGYQNPGSNKNFLVQLSSINEYLVSNKLPIIEIVNERRGIEKDGIITTINPFKAENVVFVPDGKLGIVHNAICVEETEPVEGVNYAKYDRTLLSKFRDNNPWKETTQVELNAFPGLEQIDGIFHLTTNVVAS